MRAFGWPVLFLASLMMLPHENAAAAPRDAAIGTVAGLQGSASVLRPGGAVQMPLALRDEIREGEILRTGPGARLKLALLDGSTLSIGADAELKLDHVASGTTLRDRTTVFTHVSGYLRAIVAHLQPDTHFEIHSRSMIAAVRGTDWIQRSDGNTTEIFVANGRVLAIGADRGASSRVTLRAGQGTTFIEGEAPKPVTRWKPEKIDRFVAATRLP